MSTHAAVVTTALRTPLTIQQVPTIPPGDGEVLVKVLWTASTPLDLHQADGGVLVKHPQVLGDSIAGIVVEVGNGVERLRVGDEVFGFGWREQKEKAHQELATFPQYLLGKVPKGFTLQEAVTLPNNFVTAWHTMTKDFGIQLPWPKPADYVPPHYNDPVLIWGGSSSAGQFMIQLLKFYGYQNLLVTASKQHHEHLKKLGAAKVFDYREGDVVKKIIDTAKAIKQSEPTIPLIYDPISSKSGSISPIAQIAQKGAKVAVLLPVIVRDASEETAPEYSWDVEGAAKWAEGVEMRAVRTHFYLESQFAKDYLQPTIMPTLLAEGVITPNRQKIVEGRTLLERAQKAVDMLRRKEVSGERLVWRISGA